MQNSHAMPIIKLDAIDSTNDFLKKMARDSDLRNYTTVVAHEQNKGRGQMGEVWISEPGKNLIASVLIKNPLPNYDSLFALNLAISIAVAETLDGLNIADITIKWPNDIMAENKKCGGILIENILRNEVEFDSIVGIGLNVNQRNFDNLPLATSLALHTNILFDIDELISKILGSIKKLTQNIPENIENLKQKYYQRLFRMNVPTAYRTAENHDFMAVIRGIDNSGLLILELEDGTTKSFGIKEIKMLY